MKRWQLHLGAFTVLGIFGVVGCGSSEGGVDSTSFALGSTDLVISQVYGGGGNSGSKYENDFIEIFNRSSVAVSVSGWSVQYASATGSSWSVTPLSGTIQPGHYYLVKEAAGTGGTTALPTPDATGTISMSATSAKVALVRNQTALTCGTSCVPATAIADFVGYGSSANSFEGSAPTATLGNTTSALRAGAGCTDTDNNAS
ncbi:MAG TPA: lamin tail domain-containing protein, partial [Polyangiaceae bacterium]|nr:lamin tail domain-containing protein [Polyangiaceae bacterium]